MKQTGMQTGKLRQLNAWLCPRLHDIMRECFTRDLWEMRHSRTQSLAHTQGSGNSRLSASSDWLITAT